MEREYLAHQAANPRAQGAKPTFHVVGLALVLSAEAVGAGGEGRGISVPKVAAGMTVLVVLG